MGPIRELKHSEKEKTTWTFILLNDLKDIVTSKRKTNKSLDLLIQKKEAHGNEGSKKEILYQFISPFHNKLQLSKFKWGRNRI